MHPLQPYLPDARDRRIPDKLTHPLPRHQRPPVCFRNSWWFSSRRAGDDPARKVFGEMAEPFCRRQAVARLDVHRFRKRSLRFVSALAESARLHSKTSRPGACLEKGLDPPDKTELSVLPVAQPCNGHLKLHARLVIPIFVTTRRFLGKVNIARDVLNPDHSNATLSLSVRCLFRNQTLADFVPSRRR